MLEVETEGRDACQLSYRQLLDDYASIASKRGLAAEATAIRTESVALRDVIAHLAGKGLLDREELEQRVLDGRDVDCDAYWLAALARVAALQQFLTHDLEFALKAFRVANPKLVKDVKSRRFRKLEVEVLLEAGRDKEAAGLLAQDKDLERLYYGYLSAELSNPYRSGDTSGGTKWLRSLNAPLLAHKLEPVSIRQDVDVPFNGLTCDPGEGSKLSGPLISVVMTTYCPNVQSLRASVASILGQSWQNIELIIVDDCSPDEYAMDLEEVAAGDTRIRLLKCAVNGGTYLARNEGLKAARGEFITGQDDDDWSHPRRLERQIACLRKNPASPGCRVFSIASSENLVRIRPGYNPQNPNASSLMFRRQYLGGLGGYLGARKAADTEFQKRLEKVAENAVVDLKEPLTFVRILPNSLSRGDFRAGWSHPARRAFKASYALWHEKAALDDLKVWDGDQQAVLIPRKFAILPSEPEAVDVVFAGDWRQFGGPQKSMLEEMRALREAGYSIGVLHLEAPRFMSTATKPLCAPIQELLNDGIVRQILFDEPREVGLLVLRYPPILQFPTFFKSALEIDRFVILANQAPSERDGSDIRYVVESCADHGERLFGQRGLWVPQGPTVRGAIEGCVAPDELAGFDMPGILSVAEWCVDRGTFRNNVPVIGRHSRDNRMKWPETAAATIEAYPIDGSVDVRIMGGANVPLGLLELDFPPLDWVVFDTDELPVRSFLGSLDFFVFFQHSLAFEAFGRSVLEAIASGCVVILPDHYRPVFGDGAIYCDPSEVGPLVSSLYADPAAYRRQARRAIEIAESKFGYGTYVELVETLLGDVHRCE
ncbi:glycosyltransferase [Arthrobacter sp. 179]|uniref:glycosyltransferase n=1 Tax=Arthrobacter sp. 179 TaxID=3457734 RepID=UPI0040345C9E